MDKTPIYPHPAAYARENGELEQYRASLKALTDCKCAIDKAINDNWDGMNFARDSAKSVLKQFGPEKVAFILAYTVREKNLDNRFSGHNASWANTVPMYGMAGGGIAVPWKATPPRWICSLMWRVRTFWSWPRKSPKHVPHNIKGRE